jgi:hypothetical protein
MPYFFSCNSRYPALLGAVCLLNACSLFAPPPAPPAPAVVAPLRDVVAEIRTEAAKAGDVLIIEPVQNPAVTVLLGKIQQADAQGEHGKARAMTVQAEQIEPENPVVIQFKAEMQLRAQGFAMAEVLAQKSYDASAQTGPLCVRNWLTIAEARSARENLTGAQQARVRAKDCPLKAVQRL